MDGILGWWLGCVGLIVCLRDVCWISWALRRLYGGSRSREDARCRTGEIGSCSEVVGRRGVQCMHNLVYFNKTSLFILFFCCSIIARCKIFINEQNQIVKLILLTS